MQITSYEIRFFPVGEGTKGGDAIFIRLYYDNHSTPVTVMVDGGYADTADDVIEYMDELGIDQLDYVINTHPDQDHISGLVSLFENNKVKPNGKLYMKRPWYGNYLKLGDFPSVKTKLGMFRVLHSAFPYCKQLEDIACQKFTTGKIINPIIGTQILGCIRFLGPQRAFYRERLLCSSKTPECPGRLPQESARMPIEFEKYVNGQPIKWDDSENTTDINDTSLVLQLSMPDRIFLLTGDVGKVGLARALSCYNLYNNGQHGDIYTMQLPHHGSRKNINPDLLSEIEAVQYVISCPPDGETDGHPSKRLINTILLSQPDARIVSTVNGWISFTYNLEIGGELADIYDIQDEIDKIAEN